MFKRLRRWLDERWSLKHCGCACLCVCGAVLNRTALRIEGDGDGRYTYICGECGALSTFDFALAPVPILVSREPSAS